MALVFGVLSYLNDSARDASGNIGDSIQTLAALNCYRHALGLDMPFAEFLERVLADAVPGARFVFVSRDCSHRQQLPPRVVTLMNGWFMHPGRHGAIEWPMNASVEPVFVSFHLADDRLLSPAGVAYLERFEPIGCRDVATMERLRACGIDAYFTGCLTLTIDFLPWTGARGEDLLVDVARPGHPTIRHWDPALRNRDPATMLRRALALLRRYSAASSVTTSRLHCFLPCVAMGVPVTLTQVDLQDPRLRGVEAWDYAGLKRSLAQDVGDRLARCVPATSKAAPPTYDVCFVVDEDTVAHLPVAVHSIVHNNRHARIRIHLVHPNGVAVPALEGVEVRSYAVSTSGSGGSGPHAGLRGRIPELIPEDIRLLSLDVAVVVHMSLKPLFAVDPGPTGIAMRSVSLPAEAGPDGSELRGEPTHRGGESRWGDAGVMIMDLATLRRARFADACRSHAEGLDEGLGINRFCAGDHAELRREWNLLPRIDSGIVADADHYILPFAGPEKPWSEPRPEHWQVWNWYSRRMRRQAAVVQTTIRGADSAIGSDADPADERSLHDLIRRIRVANLTYLSERKLLGIARTCRQIEAAGLPGAFLEAGCALGGSAIMIAAVKSAARRLVLYDVFGMIPPPTAEDPAAAHERYAVIAAGRSDGIGPRDRYYGYVENLVDAVTANLRAFGIDPEADHVALVKGPVQATLLPAGPVAFAHVDVDWHDPVRICLERIFPRLVPGGCIVVDDYRDWGGCRKATDEFLATIPGRFLVQDVAGSLKITRAD